MYKTRRIESLEYETFAGEPRSVASQDDDQALSGYDHTSLMMTARGRALMTRCRPVRLWQAHRPPHGAPLLNRTVLRFIAL